MRAPERRITAILSMVTHRMLGDKSMLGHRTRIVASRALVIGAAGVAAGLLGTGIASANVAVNLANNWSGNFPIIGTLSPITTTTTTSLPSPVTHGVASANFPVSVKIDAPPLATTGLETVGAATVSGSAAVTVQVKDSAGTTQNVAVTLAIPSTPTPAPGKDLVFTATGTTHVPAIAHTGNATATILSPASTTLTPLTSGGTPTVLGTFTVTLTANSTGPTSNPTNSRTLGTITVS
jgi:hypothetical protein